MIYNVQSTISFNNGSWIKYNKFDDENYQNPFDNILLIVDSNYQESMNISKTLSAHKLYIHAWPENKDGNDINDRNFLLNIMAATETKKILFIGNSKVYHYLYEAALKNGISKDQIGQLYDKHENDMEICHINNRYAFAQSENKLHKTIMPPICRRLVPHISIAKDAMYVKFDTGEFAFSHISRISDSLDIKYIYTDQCKFSLDDKISHGVEVFNYKDPSPKWIHYRLPSCSVVYEEGKSLWSNAVRLAVRSGRPICCPNIDMSLYLEDYIPYAGIYSKNISHRKFIDDFAEWALSAKQDNLDEFSQWWQKTMLNQWQEFWLD